MGPTTILLMFLEEKEPNLHSYMMIVSYYFYITSFDVNTLLRNFFIYVHKEYYSVVFLSYNVLGLMLYLP